MRLLLVKEANLYFLFLTSASNKCHAPHRRRNRGKGGGRGAPGPPNIADCHVAVYITFGPPKNGNGSYAYAPDRLGSRLQIFLHVPFFSPLYVT